MRLPIVSFSFGVILLQLQVELPESPLLAAGAFTGLILCYLARWGKRWAGIKLSFILAACVLFGFVSYWLKFFSELIQSIFRIEGQY